ncbi:MAG TPA: hypothetical protein VF297_21380 [Pyrinomonadaceae bacterium]
MECSDFYEIADSYLGDELLVETNHEVLQHLEGCAACRRELAARRGLRARMRTAFSGDPALAPRTEFAERLRTDLRAKALRPAKSRFIFGRVGRWPAAVAASLLIVVALSFFALQQRRSLQPAPDEMTAAGGRESQPPHQGAPDAHISNAGLRLSESAAGDHRDCAIKFRLAEAPIDLEEAGRKYDRAFINLASVVKNRSADLTGQFEFIESHACIFKGRRFAHVVLKHQGHVVSLLVAELEQDEQSATRSEQAAPPQDARGQVIACSRSEGFQVSCFETARHAVFVVSDLSEADNLAVARAFAPSVQEHIARAEHDA